MRYNCMHANTVRRLFFYLLVPLARILLLIFFHHLFLFIFAYPITWRFFTLVNIGREKRNNIVYYMLCASV